MEYLYRACFGMYAVSMAVQPGLILTIIRDGRFHPEYLAYPAAAKLMGLDATQIDKAFGLSVICEMASNIPSNHVQCLPLSVGPCIPERY
ncbi:MAG: hypothetical protein ACLSFC_05145 [Enterocloster bolteae]